MEQSGKAQTASVKRAAKRRDKQEPGKPTLQIVYRRLAELKTNPGNARQHSAEQIAELRAAIKRWGWTNPALIDEHDMLIAGHGRVAAAIAEGMTSGPTIMLAGLSDTEKRAYALADNKIALNSTWDVDLLRGDFGSLMSAGFDLGLTGFDMTEISKVVFPSGGKTAKTSARGLANGLTYQVIVDCAGEDEQAELLDELKGRKFKCKPMIL